MSDITPVRANIQTEAVRFRTAVSESLLSAVGGSINFINDYQFDSAIFRLDGPYDIVAAPQTAVDGLWIMPFNITIFDCAIYNLVGGSGGTTTLDILRTTGTGGSFATIFSTTPKIASTAGNSAYVRVGGAGTGLTAPVLSTTSLNAGDALRLDKLAVQTGGQNCGVIIYFRPR